MFADNVRVDFVLIALYINIKNYTILLFSGGLSKICWTKPDILQDIRKSYGEVFDVHVCLNSERRHQSVAFNPLAAFCLYRFRKRYVLHANLRIKPDVRVKQLTIV